MSKRPWRDPTIQFIDEPRIRSMRETPEQVRKARKRFVWTFIVFTTIWVLYVVTSGSVE